jgi:eukaryotic-like serine/threonine-protein kinase
MSKSLWLVLAITALLISLLSACTVPPNSPASITAHATLLSPNDGMTLLIIPAGDFSMGAISHTDEEPVHMVHLDSYWIDRTDVTNAMYARCVYEGSCQVPDRPNSYTRKPYFGDSHFGNFPVIYVTWDDANSYCKWAGGRLPTEAEWEKAARGTDARVYPWGNQLPDTTMLNYYYVVGDTSAVGSSAADISAYGVLDMAGNIREWVADWYDSAYYAKSTGSNPLGPATGADRVVRGGSWLANEFFIRSALRIFYPPDSAFFNLGFRCAKSAG